ncbi:glutamate--tRNA ligase [Amycolatopsis sp. CA-161197]|uniref:glutamate--tRNA ligase n=1 Tax=Amycolatopsis sp. CA-161197 TaxID=3239922 RepID=UPI003D8CDA75
MLDRVVIDALFPADLPEPEHWERQYPARQLPDGAKVTRFGPSPTGFVHIGGIYVATIDQDVARRSGGRYLVRVEDTDQSREVEGALEQFERGFSYFGLQADEDTLRGGDYGPYQQSGREQIYLTYVRQLLREGRAYIDFATKDELASITARQQATKLPTGYYGSWAIWRNADPADVQAKLDAGEPWVVRFRAPDDTGARVRFTDAIRGTIEAEANRNDVVILKSSDQSPRLPTYHFAHAVDDHLMRVNLVIRGDEWISSVPVHQQLFDALGFEPITYAHIAPLMKQEGGSKRKLSKRKDPEASVDFYIEAGYPVEAVLYYLRGLANGRLAELPLAQALDEPINLDEMGVAGPLVDLVKLDDISADHIATMSGAEILAAVRTWAQRFDPELLSVLESSEELALRALAVEREGAENPRKDLKKWSEFRAVYGFFFPQLHAPVTGPDDERIAALGVAPEVVRAVASDFVANYQQLDDGQEWFQQIRDVAAKHGFAKNAKELKKDPDAYPGSIREASQIIRIAITGSTRSPDLHSITQALGRDETLRRFETLTA